MIDVVLFKHDVRMGTESERSYPCATEEKARSRAAALASVNKVPPSMVKETRSEEGVLLKIVIDASPPVREDTPSLKDEEIEELRARIDVLEQQVRELTTPKHHWDEEG